MNRRLFAFSIASVLAACGGADDTADNQPPILVEDEATTPEDTAVVIDVLANDRDPEGESLRILSASADGHDVAVEEGRVRLTPAANFHGVVMVAYNANDGTTSRNGVARVTVTPVNDAPLAAGDGIAAGRNMPVAVRLGGTDVDGDALTFEVDRNPTNGTLSGTSPDLTYTPATNFAGIDTFTFHAKDGTLSSAPATITINVVEGSPPIAQAQAVTTPEDMAASITLAATDADGDALTFTIAQPPMHGTLSGTAPNLTYTPAADYSGSDSFRFTAADGLLTSAPANVSITVTPIADPPVATAQTIAAVEDVPNAIVLVGTDADGQPLTFAITTPPARGTLTGTGANRTYTPTANLNGQDQFQFTVSDGQTTSAPATVTIDVAPVEDLPAATAQSVAATEDTARVITLAGSDGDGDALTIAIASAPAHGTLSGTPPEVTYTPAANYYGPDSFTFTANDGDQTSNGATVTINVAAVDDPPVLAGASLTIQEDGTAAIPLPATDVDGETLSFTFWNVGPYTSITGTGAARFLNLCCHYNGTVGFQVTATDGHTTTAQAQFTYAVIPVPDAPVGTDDLVIATVGQPLSVDVLANDVEHDGEILSIDSVTAPAHGTIEIVEDELVYTQAPGNTAPVTMTYTVADSSGLTDTATLTIGIGEFPSGLGIKNVARVVNVTGSVWEHYLQHDVSADGRYAAVMTMSSLTPGDSNGQPDIYLYDRLDNTYQRISRAHDGGLANGASQRPSISADGRFIAFASAATNLVPGDTNGSTDVFVRDRQTGTTVRASVGPAGAQVSGVSYAPEISDDGSIVAFVSTAFQLVPDDANGAADIFVRDLVAGTTTRVSVRTGGGEADLASSEPALSGDGRMVAFTSGASNLVTGDTNLDADVFIHDRNTGVTERVSVSSTGGEANNVSGGAALSRDGRFVAFHTSANNLVPGQTSGGTFVRDRQAITTTVAAGYTSSISISGDGRYIVGHEGDGSCFVRDRFASTTQYFSGVNGNDLVYPVLSRNGRYIGILSNQTLAPGGSTTGTRMWLFANPL